MHDGISAKLAGEQQEVVERLTRWQQVLNPVPGLCDLASVTRKIAAPPGQGRGGRGAEGTGRMRVLPGRRHDALALAMSSAAIHARSAFSCASSSRKLVSCR